MKIAILASEGAPYAKSGGLGDVMEALPAALAKIPGNEVVLILPYYKRILDNPAYETEQIAQFNVGLGWRQCYAGILKGKNRTDGVQVYFIDNLQYFGGRDGALYGDGDDGERFAFFSKACLDTLVSLNFIPDVIQCNDWQTALVPVFLNARYRPLLPNTRTVFTIHNIEYQGWAHSSFFDDVCALPDQWRGVLEMNGSVNVMKGAIETADKVTTVSETYSRELMCAYYAHGLDALLSGLSFKVTGITNGIDVERFDPGTDPALPKNYTGETVSAGKAKCKAAVQKETGLTQAPDVPLLIMVTRLAEHKGMDLLCYIARRLMWEENVQLLILGTGEAHYETFFRDLEREFPGRVSAQITFDLGLASRIYAGGDIYLMPSKSEPCGLSQMNAMRYGTVPVVHATGGLKDTVPPADEHGAGGLGFTFQSYNGDDFLAALKRCIRLYQDEPENFAKLRKTCMAQDFSWDKPADKYMWLFREIVG